MLEKIDVVHFSPAGNTRKAALLLAQAMAGRTEEYDLTRPHNTGRSFGPGDVVIVAGPGYGCLFYTSPRPPDGLPSPFPSFSC